VGVAEGKFNWTLYPLAPQTNVTSGSTMGTSNKGHLEMDTIHLPIETMNLSTLGQDCIRINYTTDTWRYEIHINTHSSSSAFICLGTSPSKTSAAYERVFFISKTFGRSPWSSCCNRTRNLCGVGVCACAWTSACTNAKCRTIKKYHYCNTALHVLIGEQLRISTTIART
jgi:hypothetical protein